MSHHVHHNKRHSSFAVTISHKIQVWYIYTHWSHKYQRNVGKIQKIDRFHGSLMGSEKWTRTPSHVQKTTLPLVSPSPPCWKIEKKCSQLKTQIFSNKNTGYEYATQKRLYSLLILCSIWLLCFCPWGSDFFIIDMLGYLASWNKWPIHKASPRHLFVDFPNEDVQLDARGHGEWFRQFRPPKAWFSAHLIWVRSTPTWSCSFYCHLIGSNGPYRHPNITS